MMMIMSVMTMMTLVSMTAMMMMTTMMMMTMIIIMMAVVGTDIGWHQYAVATIATHSYIMPIATMMMIMCLCSDTLR